MPKAAVRFYTRRRQSLPQSQHRRKIVDQLGHAKAAAADAKATEDALKAELIARGVTDGEGACSGPRSPAAPAGP